MGTQFKIREFTNGIPQLENDYGASVSVFTTLICGAVITVEP